MENGDKCCNIGFIGVICSDCDINNIRGDGKYGKIDINVNYATLTKPFISKLYYSSFINWQ